MQEKMKTVEIYNFLYKSLETGIKVKTICQFVITITQNAF